MNAVQIQLRSTIGAANYGTAVRTRISCDQEPHGACAAALHESRRDEVKVERANGRGFLAGSVKLALRSRYLACSPQKPRQSSRLSRGVRSPNPALTVPPIRSTPRTVVR